MSGIGIRDSERPATVGSTAVDHTRWLNSDPLAKRVGALVVQEGVPTGFSVSQNYPNPFNPSWIDAAALSLGRFAGASINEFSGTSIHAAHSQHQA